jgi:hypothetical protein
MKASALLFYFIPLSVLSSFLHFPVRQEPAAYQIIISEIMADPYPTVMLPDAEYIELYNHGTNAVDLTGWTMVFGHHEIILPRALIEPDSFLIICENEHELSFQPYGSTLPVQNMPAVVNTGQSLTLKSRSGQVIHSVTFSPDWYGTSLKSGGGWSLEIIDPENPCTGIDNWSASQDERGGTPGGRNSILAHNPDLQSPVLLRATLPTDSSVQIHFSEPMDYSSLSSRENYSVNNGLLHPLEVYPVEPDFKTTVLRYPFPFKSSLIYTVTVIDALHDCAGNQLSGNAFSDFAVSQSPQKTDVVINEILFNPANNTSAFIELYNRSGNVVDLSSFSLGQADDRSGVVSKTLDFIQHSFILFPGNYVAITNFAEDLPHNSFRANPRSVLEHPDLFTFPVEEGLVVLMDTAFEIMDELHYSKLMHDPILTNAKGVSLERIDPNAPSDDPFNWHSASTSSGYSTPGMQNSQAITHDGTWEVSLAPDIFSPDNDGIDDFVTLHLQPDEPGWMGTIMVFDVRGTKIKDLIANCLLGADEYFTWDGKCNDERPADAGLYIIYGQITTPTGKNKNFKKVIPLVRK